MRPTVVLPALLLALAPMSACGGDPVVTSIDTPTSTRTPAAEPGPWLVHRVDLGDGHTLALPSTSTTAPEPSLSPLPLVLFSPGFSASPGDYAATVDHLASHGFAVVAADHGFSIGSSLFCGTQRDGFERVQQALQQARRRARTPGDVLEGLIGEGPLATVGHSYGGKLALWLAAEHGLAVDAVVALDPVDGGDERRPGWCGDDDDGFPALAPALSAGTLTTTMPPTVILLAGLSGDCAPAEGNGQVLFDALPSGAPATLLRLPRATHTDFIDDVEDGDCGACGLCPASQESGAEVLRLVRAVTVSFLRHRLLRDGRDAGWRFDAAVIGDDVTVEVVERR
jgi:pimeloyl-ACP methyl ester carboxylesterase